MPPSCIFMRAATSARIPGCLAHILFNALCWRGLSALHACRAEEAFYATYTARALGSPEAAAEVPSCRVAAEAVQMLSQSLETVYYATKLAGMAG